VDDNDLFCLDLGGTIADRLVLVRPELVTTPAILLLGISCQFGNRASPGCKHSNRLADEGGSGKEMRVGIRPGCNRWEERRVAGPILALRNRSRLERDREELGAEDHFGQSQRIVTRRFLRLYAHAVCHPGANAGGLRFADCIDRRLDLVPTGCCA